jgi:hypothetical protein
MRAPDKAIRRGTLVRAFSPLAQPQGKRLEQIRVDPHDHTKGEFRLVSLNAASSPDRLPLAGLPEHKGHVYAVHQSKRRPMLVVSEGGPNVRAEHGKSWRTTPHYLLAPYFGSEPSDDREGWDPCFVERIRRGEYPQYVGDCLPLDGANESILRLDHVQPLGRDRANFDLSGWQLTPDALTLLDEWIDWLLTGALPQTTFLHQIREEMRARPSAYPPH